MASSELSDTISTVTLSVLPRVSAYWTKPDCRHSPRVWCGKAFVPVQVQRIVVATTEKRHTFRKRLPVHRLIWTLRLELHRSHEYEVDSRLVWYDRPQAITRENEELMTPTRSKRARHDL